MGKTTLAVAALHKSEAVDKYPSCHFIPCDSAHTNESLVAIIGAGLGLEATCATAKHIVHHLAAGPPFPVIFDNFESHGNQWTVGQKLKSFFHS
jgi:hypothetical protein